MMYVFNKLFSKKNNKIFINNKIENVISIIYDT